MPDLSVTITGIADVLDALARVSDSSVPQTIAERVAKEVVLPKLAQYPMPSKRKQPFVSEKSRKYFFAALRSGQIAIPYRRTGALGDPNNWNQTPNHDGVTLTSTTEYSEIVRGTGSKQAKYFRGVWDTDEQIATASEADAALVATAVLVEIIGGAGP